MRLEAIHLKAFGPYTNTRLDFPGRFTMVYGANEAGKSSLLRAVLALFFGVPERTGDNFVHDYAHLRVGASLSRADGRCLDFVRRKGKTATLLDTDGKPLDERTLASFCGSLDETTFSHLFCLDHLRLRQGSSDLLAGNGEAGQSLFEAGTGLLGLKNALQQLEKEARDLFRPQGSQPTLNRALARHTDARRKQKEHLLRGDDWRKQRQAADDARQARDLCSTEVRAAQRQVERLQRVARNLPLLARWRQAGEELDGLASVPDLPEGAAQQRLRSQSDVRLGEDQCRQLAIQLEDLTCRAADLRVDEVLLGQAESVEAAFAGLGGYRDAMTDLPQRLAKKHYLEAIIEGLQGAVPAACRDMQGQSPAAARVRTLIKQHAPLATRAEETSQQKLELDHQLQAGRQRLSQSPAVVDGSVLRTALEAVRARGNLEARLAELEAVVGGVERQVGAQLAALGWWQGSPDTFERLAFPSRETLERFEQQVADIATEERRLQGEARTHGTERGRLLGERSRLEAGGEIASVARVQAARTWRETGWALIRQTYVEGTVAVSDAAARYDEQPLVLGYEKAVAEADRLVDALRADTQRVTEFSVLSRRLSTVEEAQSELAAEAALLARRRATVQAEWEDLWNALGVPGSTPKESLGRLARREDLLRTMALVRSQAAEATVVRRQAEEARRTLQAALQATGQDSPPPDASLDWVSKHVSRCLERLDDQARQWDELQRKVFEREQARSAMEPRWEEAGRRLREWHDSWAVAVVALGLGPHALPSEAEQVLDGLDRLGQGKLELAGVQGRIDGMSARVRTFTGMVERITAAVAGVEPGLPPDVAVELLYSRLGQARRAQQSRDTWSTQRQEKSAELATWQGHVARARESLEVLSRQAGCPLEELPDVERRSQRKRQVALEKRELESHLTEQNGCTVEAVLAEAAAEDRDALPGRLAAEQERLADVEQQRQSVTEQCVQEDLKLQAMDGSERAAEAAQEAQEALADIRDGADAWLRLQTSAFILRHSIEAYRERNQGPLLKRASEIFAVLTLGSFVAVRTSFDDKDRLILVGVRAGGEELEVEGMSEGTVDQLYLALRLSAIERHVAQGEPPPVLLDDILIHFDDERAQAALQVLEQVSRQTQVLFFTHHQHLVRLAQQVLGSSLAVVQLGQTELRWAPAVAIGA